MIEPSRFPALLEPSRPGRAILIGWAVTTIPALLLGLLVSVLLPQSEGPEFKVDGLRTVMALVLFAPLIETLIMAAVLEILLFAPWPKFALPPKYAVIASSLGWGIAHSRAAPVWGLSIWWPFLIFSTLYVRGAVAAAACNGDRVRGSCLIYGSALLLLRSA